LKTLDHYFEQFLNKSIPSVTISLFRIAFSLVLVFQTYYFLTTDFIQNNIINPLILFPFIRGLDPISNVKLIILGYIMLAANFGMFFNRIARPATLIFLLCFTYFWILDKGYFNNHYYFISLMCFLLILVEKKPSFTNNVYVPRLSLFALQFMVFIVYFIAGINKINPYWLFDLQPMQHILEMKSELTNNPFFQNKKVIIIASYSGLLFDLCIGFLLFIRKTRLLAFILLLIFHLGNHFLFKDVGEIGVFPFLMLTTFILFINPKSLMQFFRLNEQPTLLLNMPMMLKKFIIFFLILQLVLPFRHILFKGNVDYNGIGQRFSWRMKIMYKESKIDYFIINKMTQEKYSVNIRPMLTNKQFNNLKYYPDLIIPLAKKIKLEANEKFNIKNAKVTCEYKMKFMNGDEHLIFSPELDLTKINESKKSNKWLWELKD